MLEVLRAVFSGTAAEKQAKATINRLERRTQLSKDEEVQLKNAHAISRLFLRQALGVAATATAAGSTILLRLNPGQSEIQGSPATNTPRVQEGLSIDSWKKNYPEAINPPQEKGEFQTPMRRPVRWFNFTDMHFHQDRAYEAYSRLESFGANQMRGSFVTNDTGRRLVYQMLPHYPYQVELFILPEDAMTPSWADTIYSDEHDGALTYYNDPANINLSAVKLGISRSMSSRRLTNTPIEHANFGLLTEAAQTTIITEANGEPSIDAQEVVAISLSLSLYARGNGMSYGQYVDYAKNTEMYLPIGAVSCFFFSEQDYQKVPVIPPILTAK